jgi:uncharacterized protein YjbJ (UPF0337 family)
MNKDQVKGRAKNAEGRLEEAVGEIVGDKKMERDGKIKTVVGKVRSRYGDFKSNNRKSK